MQVKAHGRGLGVQITAMGTRAVRQWACVGSSLHAHASAGGVRTGCRARHASAGVCGARVASPGDAVGRARRVPHTPCLCERGDPSKGRAFLACKWQMSVVAMIHRDSARPYPHKTHIFIPIAMEVIAYVKGRKT